MIYVLASVLLFSFVHPLSKVFLDSGVPLSYFCVLFVGIRFVAQIPMVVTNLNDFKGMEKHMAKLLIFGACGAGLQFFEFKGIKEGLNPALVTVIMFSYPIWILLSGKFFDKAAAPLNTESFVKVALGLLGIVLVSGLSLSSLSFKDVNLFFYPLMASFFVALWIGLSSSLKKSNLSSVSLSFMYDLITLLFLVPFVFKGLGASASDFLTWSLDFKNLAVLGLHSLLIGLLPNLLFYSGSKYISPLTAAFLMSLEPVFSSFYTSIIWKEAFGVPFIVGSFLILLINLPSGFFKKHLFGKRKHLKKGGVSLDLIP